MLSSPRLEDALIARPVVNIPHNQPDIFDEFNCLNLVISTPAKPYVGADWPVMIYIHGGGGFSGSDSDWFCDRAGIVNESIGMSKQVVVVAIKYVSSCAKSRAFIKFCKSYRLSALGHLGSDELKPENGDRNGNFGEPTRGCDYHVLTKF
jgi:hypothetical protein